MTDVSIVDDRIDRISKAGSIEVGTTLGGVRVASVADLEVISNRLARGQIAVPVHCRDNPGTVFALCMQALEWGLPIMSVINKSYVPRNGDRIGYESQLIHAVIEKNAPLKNRLRYEITGTGDERRCRVWGTFKGETEPHSYTSETLASLHPGHVTKDNKKYVTGSQLWDDAPEVQMFYSTSRQWARLFCPDVLLGAYTPDEIATSEPIDVTPKVAGLADRLRAAKAARVDDERGFNEDHVHREAEAHASNSIIEGDAQREATKAETEDGRTEEISNAGGSGNDVRVQGGDAASGGARDADDAGASAGGDRPAQQDAGAAAGDQGPKQKEIFPGDKDDPNFPKPAGRRRK